MHTRGQNLARRFFFAFVSVAAKSYAQASKVEDFRHVSVISFFVLGQRAGGIQQIPEDEIIQPKLICVEHWVVQSFFSVKRWVAQLQITQTSFACGVLECSCAMLLGSSICKLHVVSSQTARGPESSCPSHQGLCFNSATF